LVDQVASHVEVVGDACLLEAEGDHEAEMEGVETEVGLVEVVASQEEVHLEKKRTYKSFPSKLCSVNFMTKYLQ
jgi:hypothetical protein